MEAIQSIRLPTIFIDNQVTSKEMILDLDRIIQDVEEAQDESLPR